MRGVRLYGPAALAALVALFAAAAPSLAAAAPAGIVMAVTGTTDPPMSSMTEIPTDTPIRLGGGSTLTFLDYARCKLVTVAGGTLTLSRSDYRTDGHVVNEIDGPCPHVYTVKEAGSAARTTGGLILRGGMGPSHWAVNSVFLLTGARAGKVRAAAVYAEDRPDAPAATFEIRRGRAVAASGAPPLSPNTRYVLRLMTSDRPKPAEVTFIATAPGGLRPVVVLRID